MPKNYRRRCGVKIDTAMISDVPGYTWGIVPALSQAGVKYFSLGINFMDGASAIAAWEDKPFYWLGPDGRQKILCWVPYKGYALGHPSVGFKLERDLPKRLAQLEKMGYPYDVVQLRWNVGGDNGPPDADASRRGEELEREARLSQDGYRHRRRVVPGVREAIRRQDSPVQRRFHAVLGERGLFVGPRNRAQPHGRRAVGASRNPPVHVQRRDITPRQSSTMPGAT